MPDKKTVETKAAETAAPAVEKKPAEKKTAAAKKPAEKKAAAAKKPAEKKATAAKKPAEKKATAAKKPAEKKTTAAKKPAAPKKTAAAEERKVFIQYNGGEVAGTDLIDKAKADAERKAEAEAKDIISQLGKGGNFEKLASSKSLDGSKANGGDLGWSPATGYVKPFADAVMALGKGQTTKAPVQSPLGFHVIKLVDSKALPTYDQMKPRFKAEMEQAKLAQYARGLREKAKVE